MNDRTRKEKIPSPTIDNNSQQPEYGLISDYGRQCLTEIVKDLSGCDDKGFKVAGFCRDIPEY